MDQFLIWNRTESREDYRNLETSVNAQIIGVRKDSKAFQNAVKEKMKDFHMKLALQDQEFKMRLYTIEERNKK